YQCTYVISTLSLTTLFRSALVLGLGVERPRRHLDGEVDGVYALVDGPGQLVPGVAEHAHHLTVLTQDVGAELADAVGAGVIGERSEEHTSELQSRENLVCR